MAKQHGVVSRRQLRAVGLDDAAIRRRAARGYLHRIHVGVYAFGNPELTQKGRELTEELFNLRFQYATRRLTNTARIREVRRDIARLHTRQRELELLAARG